ncbi:HupE / UreJ protein [Chitinophaga caeni]|uniref:HupE / UreJ protein n=1 Tax=Chitinophaga caeni TaxID=2029983 RepID=A0A291QUG7_9BACT|nr:HupE/UreJ family protein [Chitinophaga caeni]ATL47608.1 HupE / UreJ protein [Chitinophaga caeni]
MSEFGLYFDLGWKHIADISGYDHILFVMALCALYTLNEWKKVLILVTAFTIGHSITLALSVLNIVKVPTDIIEFLIPVTIVVTAFTNLLKAGKPVQKVQLNYFFALFFGLIHGLGFSNYLKSLLGTQEDITMPLFAFNLGLEFGQILIVLAILLIAAVVMGVSRVKQRDWVIFLSAAIFGIAVVMACERIPGLSA